MTKLSFGVFLNPSRDRSSSITHISQTAERAGFDYTSMQDHPHASGFLDPLATTPPLRQSSRMNRD
jgi:alkanesulfonate monooxygenase SsuD/methylene tetrahydromethanopterin reductase-like flavin-dependent oxidoreductase (luciferase family)